MTATDDREPIDSRSVAVLYAVCALIVYAVSLNAFFTSDDFYFLGLVSKVKSPLVLFEPLAGRFFRPLIVLVYYANYHAFGLSPWPYHLTMLAVHWLTACLMYLVVIRLTEGRDTDAACVAGLLFVVFGGHSEAVVWLGGAADPLMALAIVAALYCYLRAIAPGSSAAWIGGAAGALVLASQAKETWVVFPGILLAHALVFGVPVSSRRRASGIIGATIAGAIAFLAWRWLRFQSATGGFAVELNALWVDQMRGFLLRCFLPPGRVAFKIWQLRLDLLIWPIVATLVACTARGVARRIIVFAALAIGATLVPVVMLSISVPTTENERYVYLPTVFSCLLVVWVIRSASTLVPRPVLARLVAAVVAGLFVCGHVSSLVQRNLGWREAGALVRSLVDSLAEQVATHAGEGDSTCLLSGPDNLRGYFVLRMGLLTALDLMHPVAAGHPSSIVNVAGQTMAGSTDTVHVTRTGVRSFSVNLGRNLLIQGVVPSTPLFRISNQTERSYDVEFPDGAGRVVVLYIAGGRYELAGIVDRSPVLAFRQPPGRQQLKSQYW